MSWLLALLAQAAAPATPPPLPPPSAEVAQEIVVIGTRAKTWRGGMTKRDGRLVCRTKQSTGDREIDAVRCGAMLRCAAPHVAEMDRIAASDLAREERNRQLTAIITGTMPCMDEAGRVGIRMLAEQREGQDRRVGAATR